MSLLRLFPILGLFITISVHAFHIAEFVPNVVDETRTLSDEEKNYLNQVIADAHKKGILTGVYIVNSLVGFPIEDAAERVFRKWQLGEKDKDNGVLILVAILDRQMKIEVGYGLEGRITDYESAQIINQIMQPRFREGKFADGIAQAINRMAAVSAGEFEPYSKPILSLGSTDFLDRLSLWSFLYFLIPSLIGAISIMFLKIKRSNNLALLSEADISHGWFLIGVSNKESFFLKLFGFLNPGLFFVLIPVLESDEFIIKVVNAAMIFFLAIIYGATGFLAWTILSEERLRKRIEKIKAKTEIRKQKIASGEWSYSSSSSRSSGGRSASSSSSSSSSSSHSSSSSSSGGRSGGGGARGRW